MSECRAAMRCLSTVCVALPVESSVLRTRAAACLATGRPSYLAMLGEVSKMRMTFFGPLAAATYLLSITTQTQRYWTRHSWYSTNYTIPWPVAWVIIPAWFAARLLCHSAPVNAPQDAWEVAKGARDRAKVLHVVTKVIPVFQECLAWVGEWRV